MLLGFAIYAWQGDKHTFDIGQHCELHSFWYWKRGTLLTQILKFQIEITQKLYMLETKF